MLAAPISWSMNSALQAGASSTSALTSVTQKLRLKWLPRPESHSARLDLLIANHARSTRQSLEELTAAELDLTFPVNTRATLLLVQEFAAQFEPGPGGRVVLFTSGQYHGVMPGELPYIASKAALRELTPTLAAHLIARGISVNCVNPGPNNTGYADDAAWAWVAKRNPGGRASAPQDTARLVGWLVSDEAEWVTGQVIASDGGWSSLGA